MTPLDARLRDVPGLLRVLWAFTRATPWLPKSRTKWADLWIMVQVVRRGWVRMIRDGGQVAAFVVRDGRRVHAIYVLPGLRGRGFGRALINEAKEAAGRLDLWVLEANEDARKFYRSHGFIEVQRSRGAGNDEKMPDIRMAWAKGQGQ